MHVRKQFPLRNISLLSVAAVLAMVALSAPAMAGDPDYKGWYGNLDLALTQPNSLDQNFGNHTDFSGSVSQTERLVVNNDDDFTWRLGVGYSWGSKGSLQVSYWSFDNDDNESGNVSGEFNPLFISYSSYYGQYLYDNATGVDFEAKTNVKASTWDVDYIRPMSVSDKFTVKWLAGLRSASFEETDEVFAEETTYGEAYAQEKHFESDALGFRVGATAVFDFTKRFSLEASATFSFLQADTEGNAKLSDDTGTTLAEEIEVKDDNIKGEIRDFGIKAIWDVGPVDVYVGYEASNWDGLVTDPFAGGGLVPGNGNQRGRDNISFNSWNVGARWQFQGKKK